MSMSCAYSCAQLLRPRGALARLVLDRLELVVVDGVDRRADGPITAIDAVGSAMQQSGSNAGPAIAYSPAP